MRVSRQAVCAYYRAAFSVYRFCTVHSTEQLDSSSLDEGRHRNNKDKTAGNMTKERKGRKGRKEWEAGRVYQKKEDGGDLHVVPDATVPQKRGMRQETGSLTRCGGKKVADGHRSIKMVRSTPAGSQPIDTHEHAFSTGTKQFLHYYVNWGLGAPFQRAIRVV